MQTSFNLEKNESRHGKPYNVLGMAVYLKIAASDTNNEMSMFYSEHFKNESPPLHSHPVNETFYVVEGEFLFQSGDERFKAVKGSTVFIPSMMPHTYLTVSEKGSLLFMVNPAGTVEVLFERLSSYPAMPSIEEVVRLHEELGLKILGPPLSND